MDEVLEVTRQRADANHKQLVQNTARAASFENAYFGLVEELGANYPEVLAEIERKQNPEGGPRGARGTDSGPWARRNRPPCPTGGEGPVMGACSDYPHCPYHGPEMV